MLTEDKITEIFVMADEFCKVFNLQKFLIYTVILI